MKSKSTPARKKRSKISSQSSEFMGGYEPLDYQLPAIEKMLSQTALGLFAAPGLGKTYMTLAAFNVLESEGLVDTLLIVAKRRICYDVWPGEIEKFKLPYEHHIIHGKGRDVDQIQKAYKRGVKIFITNYETLQWLAVVTKSKKFRVPFHMFVIDESSKFKNSSSVRFRSYLRMRHLFLRRYILTGNPRPNHLMDLFAQIHILDGGAALGQYRTQFRSAYFKRTGFGGFQWSLADKKSEKIIYKKIAPLVHRIDENVLKLPSRIERKVPVTLPPKAMELYREMEEEMIAEFEGTQVRAFNAAVLTGKLRQIANGGLYVGQGKERRSLMVHDAKADAVAEIVDELQGQPALIAFEFGHDRDRLLEALGDGPVIDGHTTERQAQLYKKLWNEGRYPWLLGQYQSVAHGLNMQYGGKAVIIHSMTWNFDDYDQFIRRVWRRGQKEKVFIYQVVAQRTIDFAMYASVTGKERGQNAMFKILSKYISEIDREQAKRK